MPLSESELTQLRMLIHASQAELSLIPEDGRYVARSLRKLIYHELPDIWGRLEQEHVNALLHQRRTDGRVRPDPLPTPTPKVRHNLAGVRQVRKTGKSRR